MKRLFGLHEKDAATLVFKGGTSLFKAFGVIFSEDIDLSFDRADLGYTGDRDPAKEGISKKQANKLIEALVSNVEQHIAEKLLPALRSAIVDQLGEPTKGEWSLEIDAADAQTVNFHYPTALARAEYESMGYITPRVKLELGARGDPWPTEKRMIRPYAADDYPAFFVVLSARRTVWEQATALHAEAHRPAESPTPQYFSRHYYDLTMLLDSDEGKAAATDFELLGISPPSWTSTSTTRSMPNTGSPALTSGNTAFRGLHPPYFIHMCNDHEQHVRTPDHQSMMQDLRRNDPARKGRSQERRQRLRHGR